MQGNPVDCLVAYPANPIVGSGKGINFNTKAENDTIYV